MKLTDEVDMEEVDSEESSFGSEESSFDSENTYEKDGSPTEEFTNEVKEYFEKIPDSVQTMQASGGKLY